MRKFCLGLVGLVAVAGLALAPAAAQASPSSRAPSPATAHTLTSTREITLSAKECAALRKAEKNESASCDAHEVVHLTAQRRTAGPDAGTFYKGYAEACGGTPGGSCKSWWVDLHVQFTTSGSQAWVNGFSSKWCTASGTPLTECSYVNNGTDDLIIQADFTTNGYLSWVVPDGDGLDSFFTVPSWSNFGGSCVAVNNGCY